MDVQYGFEFGRLLFSWGNLVSNDGCFFACTTVLAIFLFLFACETGSEQIKALNREAVKRGYAAYVVKGEELVFEWKEPNVQP